MKKVLSLMLAAALMLSLAACGGTENTSSDSGEAAASGSNSGDDTQYYNVGETVSTDIVDFTLNDCDLSIYASATADKSFLQPVEEETMFGAKVGSSLIIPSFTVVNKDRSGNIEIKDQSSDLNLNWTVSYNGEEYRVTQYDLNFDGMFGMDLFPAAIIDPESGDMLEENDTNNYLLGAGETISFRTIGIIGVEPETLDDEFTVTIGLPSSSGKEYFTYFVAER